MFIKMISLAALAAITLPTMVQSSGFGDIFKDTLDASVAEITTSSLKASSLSGQSSSGDFFAPGMSVYTATDSASIPCADVRSYIYNIQLGCLKQTVNRIAAEQGGKGTPSQATMDTYFVAGAKCVCLSGLNSTSPYVQAFDRCAAQVVDPGVNVDQAKSEAKAVTDACAAKNYPLAASLEQFEITLNGVVFRPSKVSSASTMIPTLLHALVATMLAVMLVL
ncbi:hypothetical protein BJ742DRAFT_856824 [Cladochytrium replicatum]|nr:hypothetical protein BJ742DRAFT_856824 [Cladochytrium replicatum]